MEQSSSCVIWIPGILETIASFLPRNEVASVLRLVNCAAASLLRGSQHSVVHLSEPCPPDAFRWRWGAPGTARSMTLEERFRLLSLTATSGVLENLDLAATISGTALYNASMMCAAAAAGHLAICQWLRQRGCDWTSKSGRALVSAASAGHQDVVQWMLAAGCPWHSDAVRKALQGGHWELAEWLQWHQPPDKNPVYPVAAVIAVAEGMELAELIVAWAQVWIPLQNYPVAVAAAAVSPTPDWQAKVEWVEAQCCVKSNLVVDYMVRKSAPLNRLQWMLQRGYPWALSDETESDLMDWGGETRLQYIAEAVEWVYEGPDLVTTAAKAAARHGSLDLLIRLHNRGQLQSAAVSTTSLACSAAAGGHVRVLEWLVEHLGFNVRETYSRGKTDNGKSFLLRDAAKSGRAEALSWFWERIMAAGDTDAEDVADGGGGDTNAEDVADGSGGDTDAGVADGGGGDDDAEDVVDGGGSDNDTNDFACAWKTAIKAGSEEALDWMADNVPMPDKHNQWYLEAAKAWDMSTLLWLHRRVPHCFTPFDALSAIHHCVCLPVFRWLVEEAGCPVDWERALEEARDWAPYAFGNGMYYTDELVNWLNEEVEWRQQQGHAGAE